jgi:hypothetical protein
MSRFQKGLGLLRPVVSRMRGEKEEKLRGRVLGWAWGLNRNAKVHSKTRYLVDEDFSVAML